MKGEGIVVESKDGYAIVRVQKKSACSGNCASCGLCENPAYDVKAKNPIGALAGDKVSLYMPSSKVLFAAFLVYMLPVMVLIGVLAVCKALGFSNVATAVLSIFSLACWFLLIKKYNKKVNFESVIDEKLP